MPAYSGSPGRSKSIHYPGGSTYHPRTRRVTVPRGAPTPPAPAGGSVVHAPRRSAGRGVVAVRGPSGNVTTYAHPTRGISPKVARRRARVAKQRAQTVATSRAALKKAAILHHIAPHLTKSAHAELAKAPSHHVIAVAKKMAPQATAKALASVKQPKAPAQTKAQKPPKVPLRKLPVNEQMAVILRRHGLNKVGAAGVAGNALQESSYNPTAGTSAAGGLLGFTAGDKSMAALAAYAAAHGKDPTKTPTQTKFALTTIPPSLKSELNRSGSPEKAASIFMSKWEAPYVPTENEARRQAGARQTYEATKNLKVKGKIVGASTKAKIGKGTKYVHPFPHATMGRVDMGVDFTGTGAIRALGNGKVTATSAPGWPNGGAGPAGQGILYTLTDKGPLQGQHIYVYEGITPRVKAGQKVTKGQKIGTFYPGGSIEIGFADSAGAPLDHATYSEGVPQPHGYKMRALLEGKTVDLGTATGGSYATGTTGATGVATGATTAASAVPSAPQSVQQAGAVKAQINQRRGLTNADRARRQVLQGAIARLGKAPPKPKALALTSKNTTTALRQRKTVIAGA